MALPRHRAIAVWCLLGVVAVALAGTALAAQKRGLLVVTIRDDEGKPIPFAAVVIHQRDEFIAEGVTDETGTVNLPAAPGTIQIKASHQLFRTSTLNVSTPTTGGALTVTLAKKLDIVPPIEQVGFVGPPIVPQAAAISGRVLAPDGTPVANVTVFADSPNSHAEAVTDEDGAFFITVSVVDTGMFWVSANPRRSPWGPGPVPESSEEFQTTHYAARVPVVASQVTSGLNVVLNVRRYLRMTVHVADERGAVPDDASVLIVDEQLGGHWPVQATGVVETRVARGRVTIVATAGGRRLGRYEARPEFAYRDYDGSVRLAAGKTIEVGDQPPEDIYLTLMPGAGVRGRVVFQGLDETPRTTMPVQVSGIIRRDSTNTMANLLPDPRDPSGRVARDGSFHLEGLAGEQCLSVDTVPGWKVESVTHHRKDITNKAMSFGPSEEVDDVVITLRPGFPETESRSCTETAIR
jgi:hypothetical protein